ncbi:Hypothetical_protein [Hexamita inflata]|uniref:Hypothetical_protein n=1 Tax=Hexamita inflata TaxID=28002 RepID=A0AA86QMA0_9EUKA|nr:Hypothetical protein HINF_LOCUS49864 [Hexamita inflata]
MQSQLSPVRAQEQYVEERVPSYFQDTPNLILKNQKDPQQQLQLQLQKQQNTIYEQLLKQQELSGNSPSPQQKYSQIKQDIYEEQVPQKVSLGQNFAQYQQQLLKRDVSAFVQNPADELNYDDIQPQGYSQLEQQTSFQPSPAQIQQQLQQQQIQQQQIQQQQIQPKQQLYNQPFTQLSKPSRTRPDEDISPPNKQYQLEKLNPKGGLDLRTFYVDQGNLCWFQSGFETKISKLLIQQIQDTKLQNGFLVVKAADGKVLKLKGNGIEGLKLDIGK